MGNTYKFQRIEFPELFEGAYVNVVSATLMPWRTKKRLARLAERIEELARREKAGEELSDEENELVMREATAIAADLICGTNIPPIGSDEPVRVPVREEELDRVPGIVTERILEAVQIAGAEARPTETTPSSSS